MNLKYYIGAILSFPLLPIMYFQGKKIRASVPKLPEAIGTEGQSIIDNHNENTIQLLTIGESTIAGIGVKTHEEGFTGTLAKELSQRLNININWRVYARSGYTTKRVTYKILPKIVKKQADLIVIGLGGNDAFKLNSPKKWRADIETLIENLQTQFSNTPIVFCNMPPIKEFPAFTKLIKFVVGNLVEILGQELQKIVKDYDNVYYFGEVISLENWVRKFDINPDDAVFFSDGVHPSSFTYQTWAKDIAIQVQSNGKLSKTLNMKIKG